MKTKTQQLLIFFCIILFSLILQSCATTPQAMENAHLQKGEFNFQKHNYPVAYHYLKPLAVKGNPDAQYAIGFMYYYGLGVVENPTTAQMWIEESAAQGNPSARKALALLRKGKHL